MRRLRVDPERPRRNQLRLGATALGQGAALVGLWILAGLRFPGPVSPAEGMGMFAASVFLLQALRAALLLAALLAWLRLVRDDLARKWVWIPLALGAFLMLLSTGGLNLLGGLLVFFALTRMRWADRVSGWRRVLALFTSPVLILPFMFSFAIVVTGSTVQITEVNLSNAPATALLSGDLTGFVAALSRLTTPWDTAIRALSDLLRLHFLVAFLKFLVLPVRLRGLSLRKRFALTTALYRLVPGALGLIAVILGIYFGVGVHKSRMVRVAFDATLDDAGKVAERILSDPNPARGRSDAAADRDALEAFRPWLGGEADQAHVVVRRTGKAAEAGSDSTLEATATAGTPPRLRERIPFPVREGETLGGLVVADSSIYLTAARTLRAPRGSVTAEVYIPVDSLYLARVARRVGADLRLQVNPHLFISDRAIILRRIGDEGDTTWTDTRFELRVPAEGDTAGTGFWRERHYLARKFIPVGDWLQSTDAERRGAVLLTLSTSPRALVRGIVAEPYMLPSNLFATLSFLILALLFAFAELSAARTGASIIRGILDDVRSLTRAATRIGEGDLDHRIEVRGKDELGSLAATFNDMAANLKRHQQELLEKERLEADLALARQIQERLLPQDAPRIAGLDVAGVSLPSREVGGDLFYFLPQDGRLGLAIGDVSGKSVPAALLMSNVLAALRAETRFPVQPHEILAHINDLIVQQVETGRFVTFIYGVVDPGQGRINYASAGHNPPLKVNAAGEGEWLPVSGLALGILPGSEYTPASAALRPGDVLVLYSDGVTEAERSPVEALISSTAGKGAASATGGVATADGGSDEDLEFFEEHRLLETVRAARHGSAAEIVQAVLDAVREFTGDAPQSDDLTLVVVKTEGARSSTSCDFQSLSRGRIAL